MLLQLVAFVLYIAVWLGWLATTATTMDLELVVYGTPFVFVVALFLGILGQVPRRASGGLFVVAIAGNVLMWLCLTCSVLWLTLELLFATS